MDVLVAAYEYPPGWVFRKIIFPIQQLGNATGLPETQDRCTAVVNKIHQLPDEPGVAVADVNEPKNRVNKCLCLKLYVRKRSDDDMSIPNYSW